MTDSFEDLHKQLLAAQQQIYVKKQLEKYSADEQETIMTHITQLELSVKQQITHQLKKKVIVISIAEVHKEAKRIVLQHIIATFGSNMTIVNISPICCNGYIPPVYQGHHPNSQKYYTLEIGDIPGDMIAIEYVRELFVKDSGIIDGAKIFTYQKN